MSNYGLYVVGDKGPVLAPDNADTLVVTDIINTTGPAHEWSIRGRYTETPRLPASLIVANSYPDAWFNVTQGMYAAVKQPKFTAENNRPPLPLRVCVLAPLSLTNKDWSSEHAQYTHGIASYAGYGTNSKMVLSPAIKFLKIRKTWTITTNEMRSFLNATACKAAIASQWRHNYYKYNGRFIGFVNTAFREDPYPMKLNSGGLNYATGAAVTAQIRFNAVVRVPPAYGPNGPYGSMIGVERNIKVGISTHIYQSSSGKIGLAFAVHFDNADGEFQSHDINERDVTLFIVNTEEYER